jgi:hypothetical protein
MEGWATALTIFLVVVGAAYTWFMYSIVKSDDDEQRRVHNEADSHR